MAGSLTLLDAARQGAVQLSAVIVTRGGGGGSTGGGGGDGSGGGSSSGGGVQIGGGGGSSGGFGVGGFVLVTVILLVVGFFAFMGIRQAVTGKNTIKIGSYPLTFTAGGSQGSSGNYSAWPPQPPVDDCAAGLAGITARDPGFSVDGFLNRVNVVFFTTETAWTKLEPDSCRGVMAHGVWLQWSMQIEGYRIAGKRNVLDELAVDRVEIVAATTGTLDSITVLIRAAAQDYDIDVASGEIIRGDKQNRPFTERWNFTRPSGVLTGAPDQNPHCPGCGAPLGGSLAGACEYCQAPVVADPSEWVLARIDQV